MMSTDIPNIAEKVKFWEEQDRINKAVIPRILKAHDLVTELSEKFLGFSETVGKVEARMKEKITKSQEATHSEIEAILADFRESINAELKNMKTEVYQVAAPSRTMKLAIGISWLLSVAAIAISLIGK